MNAVALGFHNPLRSFGFRELLIQLAAKDIAEGGNAVIAQNSETGAEKIDLLNALDQKQRQSSRLKKTASV